MPKYCYLAEDEEPHIVRQDLRWYEKECSKCEGLANETRAEADGETDFKVHGGLRHLLATDQLKDSSLSRYFKKNYQLPEGYQIAPDGLLERHVKQSFPISDRYLPIIPHGYATSLMTWKRWFFMQFHVGLLGAHRSSSKTYTLCKRQVYWDGMNKDFDRWTNECLTCIRFRKINTKTPAVATVPSNMDCWQEVMIDLEGPSSPPDAQGNRYLMTYICCLCQGVLQDRSPACNAREARRMFASCVLRSGTIPSLLRSDRGPELKNALMAEYCAITGIGHRFGTAWRPCEQGLVEGAHRKTQLAYGVLSVSYTHLTLPTSDLV